MEELSLLRPGGLRRRQFFVQNLVENIHNSYDFLCGKEQISTVEIVDNVDKSVENIFRATSKNAINTRVRGHSRCYDKIIM